MEKISIGNRIKNGWNAFMNKDPTPLSTQNVSVATYSHRPDRMRFSRGKERSIVTAVLNKIAIDAAMTDIKHVRVDWNGRYLEDIDSGLNDIFTIEANLDQTAMDFKIDLYGSLLDEGAIALCPIETDFDPYTRSFDIRSMRVCKILEWYPDAVRVQGYDERDGQRKERIFSKQMVAIIQNPFYPIMNEPNSTLQRLVRKLALLDQIDESTSSDKLNMIIQLPYLVKSESRKKQADNRIADLERQLKDNRFGIAYTDGTEKITQINRPLENKLMEQIEFLTKQLFAQLGMTQEVLDGSADEQKMLNYYTRVINPIIQAIIMEMKRKFIGKTGRSQGQTIMAFRDPFNLIPVNNIADTADKFTRNEIMTSNEFRQVIGLKPAEDPKADALVNSNLNHDESQFQQEPEGEEGMDDYYEEE